MGLLLRKTVSDLLKALVDHIDYSLKGLYGSQSVFI